MPKPILAAVSAAALTLAAAGAAAQSTSGQDLTPEGPGAYLSVAGAHDLFSIRSAELALAKARRPEVRALAETMLAEHRDAAERLAGAAREIGLERLLPPAMMPMHWDMLRDLDRASASRFDDVYLDRQVDAHEVAVELHRHFAANGAGERLKGLAATSRPRPPPPRRGPARSAPRAARGWPAST